MKAVTYSIATYFLIHLLNTVALAQTCSTPICYVSPTGGTSLRNGASWSSALSAADIVSGSINNVPRSKLTRGVTYYLAGGGSYGSIAFDEPESGTTPIQILKGTLANSGNIAGWQSSFGNPAVFNTVIFLTDYYEFNGVERNETRWNDSVSYGFRLIDGFFAHRDNFPPGGDYITIKFSSVGLESATESTPGKSYGVQAWYGRHHWTITHNYFHHGLIPIHFVSNSDNIVVDRNYMGPSWGKETIMALYGGSNWTVSNNILEDTCLRLASVDNPSKYDECTTEISGWDNGSAVFNNWQVFGNLIFRKNEKESSHDGAAIWGGSAGVANNWQVYNNTIAGFAVPKKGGLQRAGIIVDGTAYPTDADPVKRTSDSNIKIYNNIWFDIGNVATGSDPADRADITCDAGDGGGECSNNWCIPGSAVSCNNIGASGVIGTNSPFNDYSAFKFGLSSNSSARDKGKNLSGISGFAGGLIDGLGTTRGQDGNWDIGAYEFNNTGSTVVPSAPRSLLVVP